MNKPQLQMVAVNQLRLSGSNMRLDPGDLTELAWSIRRYGILQPLLVTPTKSGYLVVNGHRRLAAARRAGLEEVPAIVREMDDEERLALMIVENVQRRHLSPLEEAHGFERLVKKGKKQHEIAGMIDKSQTYVSFRIKLLTCDEETQQKVHRGELALMKAIGYVKETRDGDRGHRKDGNTRWQVYYIDRLVSWLEAGRIDLDDDEMSERLQLLKRTLDALVDASYEERPGDSKETDAVARAIAQMCDRCGSMIGVEPCCDEAHHRLCGRCRTAPLTVGGGSVVESAG